MPTPFDAVVGVVSQVFSKAVNHTQFENPAVQRAMQWLSHLQAHAVGPWSDVANAGIRCCVSYRDTDGNLHPCTDVSIAACHVCRAAVCFAHAFVDGMTGAAVCKGCIQRLGVAGPQPHQAPPPPSVDPEEQRKLRRKYLRRLKLSGHPDAAEINAAWRKIAAASHPDRARNEPDRAKRHKRLKLLNEARDWLLRDLEQKAAA